jgi:hypothetical protein
VARKYRTIRFNYNLTTISIDVETQNEKITRNEIASFRTTLNGSRYKFVTGANLAWEYSFKFCNQDVFDFFNNAFTNSSSYDITFDFEEDDGSFTTYDVLIEQPQYDDNNFGTVSKSYRNFKARILEK